MPAFRFDRHRLPPETEALRRAVREFLATERRHMTPRQRAETWNGIDPELSRKLGARGWIGMTWPRRCAPGRPGRGLGRWAVGQGADALWPALTQRRQ